MKNIYTTLTGKQIDSTTVEQEQQSKLYYKKFYNYEKQNATLSITSIILGISYYEINYSKSTAVYDLLLYFTTLISLLLWINLLSYHLEYTKYLKQMKEISKKTTIFNIKLFLPFIFKLVISLLHPNPFLANVAYTDYNKNLKVQSTRQINSILCIFLLFRFYFIFSFLIYFSDYLSPLMNGICKKYFFKTNALFAVKVLIANDPGKLYCSVVLVFVYIYSFSIRVFERELSDYSGSDFNSIWNSIWFVLVTMTTVGYGDLVSVTSEGRFLTMVACINGSFFMSFTLLTLSNTITFSNEENNLYEILERIKGNKIIKEKAFKVIEALLIKNKTGKLSKNANSNNTNKTNNTSNYYNNAKINDHSKEKSLFYRNTYSSPLKSKLKTSINSQFSSEEILDYLKDSIYNYSEAERKYGRTNSNDSSLFYFLTEVNIIMKEIESQYNKDNANLVKLRSIDDVLSQIISSKKLELKCLDNI